jgi:hypothetical protein
LLTEEEASSQSHTTETISYLAVEPGSGLVAHRAFNAGKKSGVTHAPTAVNFSAPFENVPCLIADIQTSEGLNTTNLRLTTSTSTGFTVNLSEEQSVDQEVAHTAEELGYLGVECTEPH